MLHVFEGGNDGGRGGSGVVNVVLREQLVHLGTREKAFPESLRLTSVVSDELAERFGHGAPESWRESEDMGRDVVDGLRSPVFEGGVVQCGPRAKEERVLLAVCISTQFAHGELPALSIVSHYLDSDFSVKVVIVNDFGHPSLLGICSLGSACELSCRHRGGGGCPEGWSWMKCVTLSVFVPLLEILQM